MNSLLQKGVPDPTDFPSPHSAPGLRDLDASLRCNICGEVYDAPVSLNCGHSFCSCCIRSSLAVKQECPSCRKNAIESHIRPNIVVEDIIGSWKLSRPYVLGLIQVSREQKERQDAWPETPVGKKRKLGETHHDMPSYRPTGSLKSPSTSKRVKQSSSELLTTIPTSDAEEDELPDFSGTSRKPKSDDLVDCPMCNKRVAFKSINSHMDNGCKDLPSLSARSATADWQKLMSRPSKGKQKDNGSDDDEHPLAKAPYDTLKDKKLKEMLSEQGLPTNGDRNQLVQRHSRWVILFNSNLDKSSRNRKSRDELKRELKRWEEDKSKKKKITVDDTVAYQKQHQDEFARLIEAARPRGKKTERTSTPASNKAPNSMKKIPLGGDALLKEKNAEGPENAIVLDSEEEELNFVQRA